MGTFDTIYQQKIRRLEEENKQLRKLIEANELQTPSILNSIGYTNTGANEYRSTIDQSSGIDLRGVPGNQTGGPNDPYPGFIPTDLMNFIIKFFGDNPLIEQYGYLLINADGQMNWINWSLQLNNNPEFVHLVAVPLFQAINQERGPEALQQFVIAYRAWEHTLNRRQ